MRALPVGGTGRKKPAPKMDSGGATVETRRKLRASVVARLAERGQIDSGALAAAQMLGAVWLELESGIPTADSIVRLQLGGTSGVGGSKEPDLVRHIIRSPLYELVYQPWRSRTDPFDFVLCYRLICFNAGPRQLDRDAGLRHGSTLERVRSALREFDRLYGAHFRSMKFGR